MAAGGYSTVYQCSFQGRQCALKMFRNTKEESAFKEIELLFSLRHPNIIGLYAWFSLKGTLMQIGVVIELANGDLENWYTEAEGRTFSFKRGLSILAGATKGLAHMHTMPAPMIHRDVKSMNIMVMQDGLTGKMGDCGVSRRVDYDSTMTRIGSPVWAAPEVLAGKRYCEDADTYSLGIVMYEIAMRSLPYGVRTMKAGKRRKLLQRVAEGKLQPKLVRRVCRRYGVGRLFQKLFAKVSLEQSDSKRREATRSDAKRETTHISTELELTIDTARLRALFAAVLYACVKHSARSLRRLNVPRWKTS